MHTIDILSHSLGSKWQHTEHSESRRVRENHSYFIVLDCVSNNNNICIVIRRHTKEPKWKSSVWDFLALLMKRKREKDKNNNIRSHQYNSHKHMQWNICCARDSYDITFKTIIIFWVKKSTSVNFNTHDDRVIASFFRDHSNELFMFYHN